MSAASHRPRKFAIGIFQPAWSDLFIVATLAAFAQSARAEENTIRLHIHPMAAPRPALKYQLLPEVRELNPGNPAQFYFRCFAEQRNFFFTHESDVKRAGYLSMPLDELPAEELRHYGGGALTQADWAARLDALDWGVLSRVQNDGFDLLLPELGPFQTLARSLHVRFRGQVAGRHFDEACGSAKTMLAFARHLGEYPAEPANLLGLSVADRALDALEEMVQQPGCPNLYWALTDLPSPMVDLRKGLQADAGLMATELRLLRNDSPMSEAQLQEAVSRLSGIAGFSREQTGQPLRNLRRRLEDLIKDPERVAAARMRLVNSLRADKLKNISLDFKAIADGILDALSAEKLVQSFPPVQVILLDEKRQYEIERDDQMKLLALAPWQIDLLAGQNKARRCTGLFADFLPHVARVRQVQARVEERIALLRHVEALRLYAAENRATLPAKLCQLSVPLPEDPVSGKAINYTVNGNRTQLRGAPPRQDETMRIKFCYELSVGK